MLNVITCKCGKLVKCEYVEDHYIAICECGHYTIIKESVFDVYGFMLYQDSETDGLTSELGEGLEQFVKSNMELVNGIYKSITKEYFALFENQLYKVVTPEAYEN